MAPRSSFASTLDELQGDVAGADDFDDDAAFVDPLAKAPPFLWNADPAAVFARAHEYLDRELGQDVRPEPPPAPPTVALPPDDIEAIERELALFSVTTRAGLIRARRRFMWANHPDRRPEWPRDLATRRVALANMLIDRALRLIRDAR